MAWRHMEGFEVRKNSTALAQGYNTSTFGSATFVAGRLHGTALKAGTSSSTVLEKIFDSQTTWVVGLAIKRDGTNDGISNIIELDSDSGVSFEIALSMGTGTEQKWRVTVGATNYDSTATWEFGTWYYVELKTTINDTTGSFEVRVNGTTVLSQSGIDTSGKGGNAADRVKFNLVGSADAQASMDDVYVLDGTGSDNDFLGDGVVEGILPNGAGNSSQWTPFPGSGEANYADVDDPSGPDNDSTYVSTASTSIKDTYQFSNLAFITGNVLALQTLWNARLLSSGSRTLRPIVRHGGTDYAGSNKVLTSTAYVEQSQVFATNPGTGAAWTVSDINAAEFGLEAVA